LGFPRIKNGLVNKESKNKKSITIDLRKRRFLEPTCLRCHPHFSGTDIRTPPKDERLEESTLRPGKFVPVFPDFRNTTLGCSRNRNGRKEISEPILIRDNLKFPDNRLEKDADKNREAMVETPDHSPNCTLKNQTTLSDKEDNYQTG
jgi:hypothetical protein